MGDQLTVDCLSCLEVQSTVKLFPVSLYLQLMVDRSLYQYILYHGPRLLGDHRGRSLSCPLYYLLSFVPFVPLFCICPSMSMRWCPPMPLLALQGALYAALCNSLHPASSLLYFHSTQRQFWISSNMQFHPAMQCNSMQHQIILCQSCRSARRHFLLCSCFSYFVYRFVFRKRP